MKHLSTLILIFLIIAKPISSQICEVTLESRTHVTCNGGSDGMLEVKGSGYQFQGYKWSTGATTKKITNLKAGFYSVTVTCYGGSPDTEIYQISQPSTINYTYRQTNVNCAGFKTGSISHMSTFGGSRPYTYAWSNGAKTSSISGLSAGNYTLTITDSKGCTTDLTVKITEPQKLSINTTIKDNLSCFESNNGRIEVDGVGGVSPYTFDWSNGETTQRISNLKKGVYRVTVTDKNGCLTSASYQISEPTEVGYENLVLDNVDCNGNSTGALSLEGKGGSPGYSYRWNTGASSRSISGLKAGNYTVSITDRNKCEEQFSFTVSEPTSLGITLLSQTNNSCNGNSSGVISVEGSGGAAPYTYSWSTGQTSSRISKLKAGEYEVTILDNNKCEFKQKYIITDPDLLSIDNSSITNNDCFGEALGSIKVTPIGGTPPYRYQWAHGPITNEITGLKAGTYSLEVIDNNDCVHAESYDIIEPIALAVEEISLTHNNCNGQSKGSIKIDITGGTPPYDIQWNNGQSGTQIQSLKSGQYKAEITDHNGCTTESTFTISEPELLEIELLRIRSNGCGETEAGSIHVHPFGGTAPYTFLWSNGGTGDQITDLSEGKYTLLLTDNKGCVASESYNIKKKEELQIDTLKLYDNLCYNQSTGSIEVIINNGTGRLSYNWSNGDTTQEIRSLKAGHYYLEVTDASGCKRNDTFKIDEPSALESNVIRELDVLCNGESNGLVELETTGGTGPYKYSWSNGHDTPLIDMLEAGEYVVEITDMNSCMIRDTHQIKQPDLLEILIQDVQPDRGSGNGSISIDLKGGTPGYLISWKGPNGFSSSDQDISGLEAGSYTCEVLDANKCQSSLDSVEVHALTNNHAPQIEDLQIYPNPTFSDIYLRGIGVTNKVTILNILGNPITTLPAKDEQMVPIKAIVGKPGVYFIVIEKEGTIHSKRLIVK